MGSTSSKRTRYWTCASRASKRLRAAAQRGELYAGSVAQLMYEDQAPALLKVAAVRGLADMGNRGACHAEEVCNMLYDPDANVRIAAIEALSNMGGEAADFIGHTEAMKVDAIPEVRDAADK